MDTGSTMARTERLAADAEGVSRAAALLLCGETVALPTETVYGLGAHALEPAAVAKVFSAKQRPGWDPLIVHVWDRAMLERVAVVPDGAKPLIEAFWPGPLTLLLPRMPSVPDAVTAGRALVGVRMPRHPVMLEVLRAAGIPVAAPSANRFGHTSPTTAEHVLEDLDGRIAAVLDGGPTQVGVESTVLDVSVSPMVIYRPGAVTLEQIQRVAGPVRLHVTDGHTATDTPESLPSPGVGIRHYAPRAKLLLVRDEVEMEAAVARLGSGMRVGVMLPDGWRAVCDADAFAWGDWTDGTELARRLFAGLRDLDARGVDVIVCPLPQLGGVGEALRDRLEKAARRS